MVEVSKTDIRERYRKSSKVLDSEIEKGFIKKKRPIKVIDVSKSKKPHEVLQTLRAQYILGKLTGAQQKRLSKIEVQKGDMFSACNLGYDGMMHNKRLVDTRLDSISKLKKPSIPAYKKLMSPLGNMIIAYRVLKHYCADKDLLEPNKLERAKEHYGKIKKEIETIDIAMVDEPRLYRHDLTALKRKVGVIPMSKKYQAPILYNVDGRAIKSVDLFDIDELITEFEDTHRGKYAVWQGAQTKAFREWMETI